MKNQILRILLGVITSTVIIGLLFYCFIFLNPLRIYESNTLKWIPILIAIISLYCSGRINQRTAIKLLPILLVPLIIFKLFDFTYFPFVIVILIVGILSLLITRKNLIPRYRKSSWVLLIGIFLYFLFSQPLILEQEDFEYDENGNITNAIVLWDFTEKKDKKLPNHLLLDRNNGDFNLNSLNEKTYFITFWATWCAPCMREKPELENLKRELKNNDKIEFIDISFDDDRKKKWVQYLENSKPEGLQLISENQHQTSRALDFAGIPMHIIVNKEGQYKKFRSFQVAREILIESLNTNNTKAN